MKDALNRRLVELTRDLVLIPTTAAHPSEIDRGIEFIKNHLDEIDGLNLQVYESQGAPSLVAFPDNHPEPEILFCAHLDVVSLPGGVQYKSHIENGRVYGPGAGDMKGPLAIILEIFRDMHLREPGISLGLVVSTDEERGGKDGVEYLFGEKGIRCGLAIIPDSGSLNCVTVEEKGSLQISIHCHGPAGHACRPWLVDNPLERLMERLGEVKKIFAGLKGEDENWRPTFTVTILSTPNEAYNRIPGDVEAICDIRFTPPYTSKKMLELIKGGLDEDMEVKKLISAETSHYAPDPLFLEITEEITGKPARLFKEHGGSDARFFSILGIPVIMSRPEVGNIHSAEEWVDIESMGALYRIYEQYITRKLRLGRNKKV